MKVLERLFHRASPVTPAVRASGPCLHVTMVPRWNSVADMGHEEAVSSFTCEACHAGFTAAEGRALRETEAERLRQLRP